MPGAKALCTSCDHTWTTRKPPEEIERPRCSECGASGREIVIGTDDDATPTESRAIAEARQDRRTYELEDRIDGLLLRLEGTAPTDTEAFVAEEVRGDHRELESLLEHLDQADGMSLEELEAIDDRVDEIEAAVDEHAEELDRIDSLADTVAELEVERDDLEAEIDELEHRLDEKRDVLSRIENKEDAFEAGEKMGRHEARGAYEIRVPCSVCGEDMIVEPRSEMHQAIVNYLHSRGWRHRSCQTTQQAQVPHP